MEGGAADAGDDGLGCDRLLGGTDQRMRRVLMRTQSQA